MYFSGVRILPKGSHKSGGAINRNTCFSVVVFNKNRIQVKKSSLCPVLGFVGLRWTDNATK